MRNPIKLLCVLLIGALLLTGCNMGVIGDAMDAAKDTVSDKTFTNSGVTMTLTTKFIDFTNTDTNQEKYPFFYASDTHAVFCIKETKAELAQLDVGELTVKRYAELVVTLYELDVPVEEKDGKVTLTYEADEEDGSKLVFTCLFLESKDAFWFIQASCPGEQYEADRDQIWRWLTSATFTAG